MHTAQHDQHRQLGNLPLFVLDPKQHGQRSSYQQCRCEDVDVCRRKPHLIETDTRPRAFLVPRFWDGVALEYADEEHGKVKSGNDEAVGQVGVASPKDQARDGRVEKTVVYEDEGEFGGQAGQFEEDLV